MTEDLDPAEGAPAPGLAAKLILPVGLGLIALAVVAFYVLKPDLGPPPVDVAKDPLLASGRTIYLSRCASCHGERGRGDGPMKKGLAGPPPRDFVEDPWKHGERPEQVLTVVSEGVKGTAMGGWKYSYSPEELRAAAAYVYYLAGKPVPAALRAK